MKFLSQFQNFFESSFHTHRELCVVEKELQQKKTFSLSVNYTLDHLHIHHTKFCATFRIPTVPQYLRIMHLQKNVEKNKIKTKHNVGQFE